MMATSGRRATILLALLLALAAAAWAAPPALGQASAAGAPVCGRSPSAGTVCIIMGNGTLTFQEPGGGFAYLTSAPVSPDSAGAGAPAGTELEIQPQASGTVTIDSTSVTISVDPGSLPELDEHGSGIALADCALQDGAPNTIRCPFTPDPSAMTYPQLSFYTRAGPVAQPIVASPSGPLAVTAHAAGEPQPADVSEADSRLLIDPNSLALLALTVQEGLGVNVAWDGNQFSAAGLDGYTAAVSPADGCQSGVALSDSSQFSPPRLDPASTVVCSPVTGGALDVTLTPPPTVNAPGPAPLSVGAAVRFQPSPAAAAAERAAAARRATPSLLLINNADESFDADPEDSGLNVSAPSGASLEILGSGQPQRCSAADATASTIACTWPDAGETDLRLSTLAPGSAALSLSMPDTTNAWLFLPAAEADGSAQTLSLSNESGRPADVEWDGETLTVSVANLTDKTLEAEPAASDSQQNGLPGAACQTAADQPNVLTCTTPAPSSTVNLRAVTPPPPDGAPLPFLDAAGAGTLTFTQTGPDLPPTGPALILGSAGLLVALAQGSVQLSGAGAVRISPEGTSIFFSLDGGQGAPRLFEGTASGVDVDWSATGIELTPGAAGPIQHWSAGQAPSALPSPQFVGVSAALAPCGSITQPGSLLLPLVGPDEVSDDQRGVVPSSPQVAGSPGQPVNFTVTSTTGLMSPDFTFAYHVDFGDGSQDDSTGQGFALHCVEHAYAAAGTYTVVITVSDSTGVSAFSAVQIRIADAAPAGAPSGQ